MGNLGKFKDKTGKKFGKILVLFHGDDQICDCYCESCGNIFRKKSIALTPSGAKSCGCANGHNKSYPKHMKEHKLYSIWSDIRRTKGKNPGSIESWKDYRVFYKWAIDKWKPGLRCYSKDFNKPHGPDNTIFVLPDVISKESQNRPEVKEKLTGRPNVYNGKDKHSLYKMWLKIKKIGVCKEWNNYLVFYDWAIEKYFKRCSLVKIDSKLDFGPENTKIISNKESRKLSSKTGFESFLSKKDVRERIKQTCLDKYGVANIGSCQSTKEKIKNTNLEKYGVESFSQTQEFIEKTRKTSLERYGVEHYTKLPEYKAKTRDLLKKNNTFKTYNGKLISELKPDNLAYSTFQQRIQKYGIESAISREKHESGLESFFKENIIKGLDFNQQCVVDNYRADFQINNLIIECDGLFWHSDFKLDKNYHKDKRECYIQHGYTPLFFREDEITKKPEIVKSIILNKLGQSVRIFARKCTIKNINNNVAKDFFEKNHLMGNGNGSTFGLYYDNKLISCLQAKKKDTGLDISRFCHLNNHMVIGGFSKLVKHIIKEYNPDFIQTFIDLRYGFGEYLKNLGFVKETEYLSFKWTDFKNTFHRLNFRNNSGYEYGLYKIWDCGQSKWVKKIKR